MVIRLVEKVSRNNLRIGKESAFHGSESRMARWLSYIVIDSGSGPSGAVPITMVLPDNFFVNYGLTIDFD
jgi:hypothetical protein